MKIQNQSMILIIRDGEMLEAKAIAEKLETSIVIFKRLLKGEKLENIYLEAAKTELQNLKDSLLFIQKAGADDV